LNTFENVHLKCTNAPFRFLNTPLVRQSVQQPFNDHGRTTRFLPITAGNIGLQFGLNSQDRHYSSSLNVATSCGCTREGSSGGSGLLITGLERD